jgi:hypothetical protein
VPRAASPHRARTRRGVSDIVKLRTNPPPGARYWILHAADRRSGLPSASLTRSSPRGPHASRNRRARAADCRLLPPPVALDPAATRGSGNPCFPTRHPVLFDNHNMWCTCRPKGQSASRRGPRAPLNPGPFPAGEGAGLPLLAIPSPPGRPGRTRRPPRRRASAILPAGPLLCALVPMLQRRDADGDAPASRTGVGRDSCPSRWSAVRPVPTPEHRDESRRGGGSRPSPPRDPLCRRESARVRGLCPAAAAPSAGRGRGGA